MQNKPRNETTCLFLSLALAGSAMAADLGDQPTPEMLVPDAAVRERIESAVPARASATPKHPRRLLIYDGNVGYGGHPSIAHANLAFMLMGRRTGSHETVITRDPAVFEEESLRLFDAVFFNNTVGNLFENPVWRRNLAEFVHRGGGMMGVHGTSVAFTRWPGAHEDWPEFGRMIGARGANHRDSDEHVFAKLDDPDHPVNRVFAGRGFDYRDEFFRVHEPYSRDRLRILFSIDTVRTDMEQGLARGNCVRADNDYALAWVRGYGRGRTFYCTIAHNPYVFWDSRMLGFYLDAVQFVLGDLEGSVVPSSRLSEGIRARETLGWRLALDPDWGGRRNKESALCSALERANQSGVVYVGVKRGQRWNDGEEGVIVPGLGDELMQAIRLGLDDAGARILTYKLEESPDGIGGWRREFDFAQRLGAEIVVARPAVSDLGALEALCSEFELKLAIPLASGGTGRLTGPLADAVPAVQRCSARIGFALDVSEWAEPSARAALEQLLSRIGKRVLHARIGSGVSDVNEGSHGGPWLRQLLLQLKQRGVRQTVLSLAALETESAEGKPSATAVEWIDQQCVELAGDRELTD